MEIEMKYLVRDRAQADEILNDEIVTIYFVGGGTKSVFVTCDSKLAIIEDVMKIVY
jgi:hypothetical protein